MTAEVDLLNIDEGSIEHGRSNCCGSSVQVVPWRGFRVSGGGLVVQLDDFE